MKSAGEPVEASTKVYRVALASLVATEERSKAAEDAVVDLHVLSEPRGHFEPEGTSELTEAWLIRHLGCHQGAKERS